MSDITGWIVAYLIGVVFGFTGARMGKAGNTREELAKVFEEGREAGWADCRYEPGSENPYLDTKDRKWSHLP